jgi:hypothetical protein
MAKLHVYAAGSTESVMILLTWAAGNLASPDVLTLPTRRGVVMTMSEYEERFRTPAPSLHQIFASLGDQAPHDGGVGASGLLQAC